MNPVVYVVATTVDGKYHWAFATEAPRQGFLFTIGGHSTESMPLVAPFPATPAEIDAWVERLRAVGYTVSFAPPP